MSTDRLDEIETRLTFQEQMLTDLNDVIVRQQSEIMALQATCKHLQERMGSLIESTAHQAGDEVPPHY